MAAITKWRYAVCNQTGCRGEPGSEALRVLRRLGWLILPSQVSLTKNQRSIHMRRHLGSPRTCPIRNRPGQRWAPRQTKVILVTPSACAIMWPLLFSRGWIRRWAPKTEFFAQQVDYFGQPNVSRDKFGATSSAMTSGGHNASSASRATWRQHAQPNGTVRVTFPLRTNFVMGQDQLPGRLGRRLSCARLTMASWRLLESRNEKIIHSAAAALNHAKVFL